MDLVYLETREKLAVQVRSGFQVFQETQDPRVSRALQGNEEILDREVTLDHKDLKVQQDHKDCQDQGETQEVLDHLDHPVVLDQLEILDLEEIWVHRAHLDLRDQMDQVVT